MRAAGLLYLATWSCAAPPRLDDLEPVPDWPEPCPAALEPRLQPPTVLGPGGWSAAPGQVIRPDGSVVAVPGIPESLDAAGSRALVALGWAGAVEVGPDGAHRLPLEGNLVDVAITPEGAWFADARGQVLRFGPRGVEAVALPGWPRSVLVDGDAAWVSLDYGGLVRVSGEPLRATARRALPHGPARALAGDPAEPTVAVGDRVVGAGWEATLPGSVSALLTDGDRLYAVAGGRLHVRSDQAFAAVGSAGDGIVAVAIRNGEPWVARAPAPPPSPATGVDDGATIGAGGEIQLTDGATGWSVAPGVVTRADQVVRVGERVVASHGADGSLSVSRSGALERWVHLDGAVGRGTVIGSGDGTVWASLPWVGAQQVDPATGASRTWRFAPGAVDLLVEGDLVLAARGAYGLARLSPDGTVDACHPGQPVEELALGPGGERLARTGTVWQPLPRMDP